MQLSATAIESSKSWFQLELAMVMIVIRLTLDRYAGVFGSKITLPYMTFSSDSIRCSFFFITLPQSLCVYRSASI